MKKLTEAVRAALSFAIHIPVGLRAQDGNFKRTKILDRAKFSFSIAGAALVLALIASPDLLAAQNIVTGGVTGTVTDPSGGVVAHATVTLKNPATGDTNTATTNDSGIYLFSFLKPGEYTLTVAQTGFSPLNQSVRVLLGQTVTANLKIDIEKATANIEVTAGGTLLQTEDANITANVSNREIANIPNPGGDITYNAILTPGITGNTSSGGGFGNFSAFGLPGTSNLFTVNGNDYNDPFLNLNNSGASNLLLGSNEVEEVAVVVNGYTGQYGRQAGAQIDYSTKSGTNAFHGDAIYNWTGRALSANDFFNNAGGVPRPFVSVRSPITSKTCRPACSQPLRRGALHYSMPSIWVSLRCEARSMGNALC
ncbi:MAG TPA: carboxypeptidase-like regulatory domain-containing protein [Terriglobales bacterium]|jgi:hypothetical protein|nr:carboxypeptidase-like regulatory domain-containing protein [Terriglobales bacterium]